MKHFRLLALIMLMACGNPYLCSAQLVPPAVNITQLIDSITLNLNRHYIFPEEAHQMSAYLQARAQEKAYRYFGK